MINVRTSLLRQIINLQAGGRRPQKIIKLNYNNIKIISSQLPRWLSAIIRFVRWDLSCVSVQWRYRGAMYPSYLWGWLLSRPAWRSGWWWRHITNFFLPVLYDNTLTCIFLRWRFFRISILVYFSSSIFGEASTELNWKMGTVKI